MMVMEDVEKDVLVSQAVYCYYGNSIPVKPCRILVKIVYI